MPARLSPIAAPATSRPWPGIPAPNCYNRPFLAGLRRLHRPHRVTMTPASSSTPQTEYGGPLSSTMIFLLPALALSSKVCLGLVQLLILLMLFRRGPLKLEQYRRHWSDIGGVLIAFGSYFLVSLLRLLLDRQSLHTLDGPSRLLFGLSCLGV